MDWKSISRLLAGLLCSEIRSSSRKAFLENLSLIDGKRDAERKKRVAVLTKSLPSSLQWSLFHSTLHWKLLFFMEITSARVRFSWMSTFSRNWGSYQVWDSKMLQVSRVTSSSFEPLSGSDIWNSVCDYSLKFKTVQSQRITRVATNRETRFDSSFVGDVAFLRGKVNQVIFVEICRLLRARGCLDFLSER